MNTKEIIIQKALELFSEKGYDAVGIQEIVNSSDVTKPTLYHYFGNKEGLLQSLLEVHFNDLFYYLSENTQYHGDLPQDLENMTRSFLLYTKKNNVFFKLLLSMDYAPTQSVPYKTIKPLMEKYFKYFEKFFINATRDHGNIKNKENQIAISFIGILHTYSILLSKGYLNLTDSLPYKIIHQFLHGILS